MTKITKDQKIKALERILKAVFGGQEGKIEYRSHWKDYTEIIFECDVDDAVKTLSNLSVADINYWFCTGERKIAKKDYFTGRKFEGYTEICLTLSPQYWKEVDKLKEEIKRLRKNKDESS